MIGITSLEDRRIRGDMIEVYKLLAVFNFTNAPHSLRGHEKWRRNW